VHLANNLKVGSNEFWLVFVLFLFLFLKHELSWLVFGNKCFRIKFGLVLNNFTILIPRILLLVSILKPFVEILVRFVFELIIFISHDGSITFAFFRLVFWLLFDFKNKWFNLGTRWLALRCHFFDHRTLAILRFYWWCLTCLFRCSNLLSVVLRRLSTRFLSTIIRNNIYL